MTDLWNVAAVARDHHIRQVKPKTRDGSDANGYVYVPKDWLGEPVLALIGVDMDQADITTQDGTVRIMCEMREFDRPTPTTRGNSAAIWVHSDYVGSHCIVLLDPTSFAIELQEGES